MSNISLWIGLLIRLSFIIYAEIQDRWANLKYTDLDYSVYTDGAMYAYNGGTPYDRHTYRYTPLLSYMMIPNIFFESFGKILFSFIDIAACFFIKKMTNSRFLENLWIFNPLTIQVSTRGNADTIVIFLVYATLYLLKKQKYVLSAITYGLVVHFKIYPIIYSLPLYFFIDHQDQKLIFMKIFSKHRLQFALISGGVFLALLGLFCIIYPDQFLYETYLYHLIRKDNRHNFSAYFYYIYLNYSSITALQATMTFLPQFTVIIAAGLKYYKDLPFALFLQTLGFVVFNKVCTAQYFVWWMALLPIALVNTKLTHKQILIYGILWLICEVQWNLGAYLLEIRGYNSFTLIFVQCMIFFIANVALMATLIKNHRMSVFQVNELQKIK